MICNHRSAPTLLCSSYEPISGCLWSTQVLWLPLLTNTAPPRLCWNLAIDIDNINPSKLAYVYWCLWPIYTTACIWTSSFTVQRSLLVGFCGQPHYCNLPLLSGSHGLTSRITHRLCWYLLIVSYDAYKPTQTGFRQNSSLNVANCRP